jgi:RHS repeat-associated protein
LTGYTGHVQTDATRLIYMRGRYYSPSWHRFLNSDHGLDANIWNQNSYTGGSPLSAVDPSGMASVTCTNGRSITLEAVPGETPEQFMKRANEACSSGGVTVEISGDSGSVEPGTSTTGFGDFGNWGVESGLAGRAYGGVTGTTTPQSPKPDPWMEKYNDCLRLCIADAMIRLTGNVLLGAAPVGLGTFASGTDSLVGGFSPLQAWGGIDNFVPGGSLADPGGTAASFATGRAQDTAQLLASTRGAGFSFRRAALRTSRGLLGLNILLAFRQGFVDQKACDQKCASYAGKN